MMRPTEEWSESTLRLIGLGVVTVAALSTLLNVMLSLQAGNTNNALQQLIILVPFVFVLVWLFRSVPRNAAVWTLAWAALLGGGSDTAGTVLVARTGLTVEQIFSGTVDGFPAELDLVSALALNYATWAWLGIFLLSVHFVLLFPSGEVSAPRWRYLIRGASAVLVIGSVISAVAVAPWVETSFADLFDGTYWAAGFAGLLLMLATIPSIINLILRFRRSAGEERLQYLWVTWALGLNVVVLLNFGWLSNFQFYEYLSSAALASIPLAVGVAITKYRLYDIDVVISRTLVYGTLAGFIGVVYVGIVVGIGSLVGDPGTNTWLQILATVIIAITFQPLRRWLQRIANRIVFGRRSTPYEVLSSFSQAVSAVDPGVLTEVARSLADGTTANSASIWAYRGDRLHCIAAWPALPGEDYNSSSLSEPVFHDAEKLGVVALDIPPGQPFPTSDQRLLEQVASGLGLALRNLRLTEDLRDRVEELAASRRRIVALQDETRRRLERDLHDGAQQRLVSLKIKLGIGSSMAEKAGLEDLRAILDDVREETDDTIESVRDFARGIYPPLLEAEGLGAALSAQARKMPIPVIVQSDGLGRFPKEHEATIYFCVLEALQNAMKHSEATLVQVLLSEQDGELTFEVRDDGVGFDRESVVTNGLVNMKDRTEAIGGEFDVESKPGRGTTIKGSLPVPELVSA